MVYISLSWLLEFLLQWPWLLPSAKNDHFSLTFFFDSTESEGNKVDCSFNHYEFCYCVTCYIQYWILLRYTKLIYQITTQQQHPVCKQTSYVSFNMQLSWLVDFFGTVKMVSILWFSQWNMFYCRSHNTTMKHEEELVSGIIKKSYWLGLRTSSRWWNSADDSCLCIKYDFLS